jgi:hypothetical protein
VSPQGEYIYGIIEEPQLRRFCLLGVGGAEVYTINHQQIAAVVSDTGSAEIDPTRKNVHAHTVVQDELLKEYTLLPMGFGMIAPEDEVRLLLENNYPGLVSELNRLAGRIEVELKVSWDQGAVMRELNLVGNCELARIRAKLEAASSLLETRNLLVEAGKLVEHVALNWNKKYAELVYSVLKELSDDARVNNPMGIQNLLNASFLIEKSRESEFREKVYKLDTEFQGKVNFKYVGPMPPYNFVALRLEPVKC